MIWVVLTIAVFCLLGWRFPGRTNATYGSARWANVWELFKAGLFEKRGFRIADFRPFLGVYQEGGHGVGIGSSGSGKGTCTILPNLLELKNVLLVDPGGENTAVASKFWRDQGIPFHCINPFGLFTQEPWSLPADGFNPLRALDPAHPNFAADSLVIAEMLVRREGNEGGSTAYFKDSAQRVIRALVIHIMTAEPEGRRHLGTLYGYATGSAEEFTRLTKAMLENEACGGLVRQEANTILRIEAQASEEFSAVWSTIQQELSWLADPLVRDKMAANNFSFSMVKNEYGGAVSVVLPLEYSESHAAITRLALACAMLEMQCAPHPQNKVYFLIDEAASLGRLQRFPHWLATIRKYGAVIWSFWQSAAQIKHLYGQNWQTIVGNCEVRLFLNFSDVETAEYGEKLLGKATVGTSSRNSRGETTTSVTGRPLLTAGEMLTMNEVRAIALVGSLPPLLVGKVPYWQRPDLAGRFHPNPYYQGKTSGPRHVREMRAKIYYALLCLMAPHPKVKRIYLGGLAVLALAVLTGGM